MRYYCEIVPFELAKKLKEAGYPQDNTILGRGYNKNGGLSIYYRAEHSAPMYCEVFDWLLNKSFSIEIQSDIHGLWKGFVAKWKYSENLAFVESEKWHAAANAAIEKACEILRGNV